MKCPKCGYETVWDEDSLGDQIMQYIVITLCASVIVGGGCFFIINHFV